MEQDNLHSPVAITYAEALLELATEQADNPGSAEIVGQELADVKSIVGGEPMIGALFTDPSVSQEERGKLLDRVFANRVSPLLLKFLQVLSLKNRLNMIGSINGAYQELLEKRLGKVEVDVTVAERLGPEAMEEVRKRVSAALKRDAVLHQYVDPSIIGGLILRVQDRLIDGSVKSQLASLREQLRTAQPGT